MEIRPAELHDVCVLKDTLREVDALEVFASHGATPEKALLVSYTFSEVAFTVLSEGVPIGMFGIVPADDSRASVWLLGSNGISGVKKDFLAQSIPEIKKLLERYPVLFNYVDARYTKSINWLRRCGAIMEEAKPWGHQGLPFHYFEFRRA